MLVLALPSWWLLDVSPSWAGVSGGVTRAAFGSAHPLNIWEEQSWSHSSLVFFGFQLGLALVVLSVLVPIFAIANSSRYRAKSGQGILSQLYWVKPGLFAAYAYVRMFLARLMLLFSKAASSAALVGAGTARLWRFSDELSVPARRWQI